MWSDHHSTSGEEPTTDRFVTSYDVFSRRPYFDPHMDRATPATAAASTSESPRATGSELKPGTVRSASAHDEVPAAAREEFLESTVSRVKQFSSAGAFVTANSVKDILQETLCGAPAPGDVVGVEVLMERRKAFLDSLFSSNENLQVALPCRFSERNIDRMLNCSASPQYDSTALYRKRLAALQRLRETLEGNIEE